MKALWERVLDRLRNSIASEDIDEWLMPLVASGDSVRGLVLCVPQPHLMDWIQENYLEEIHRVLAELGCPEVPVDFIATDDHIEEDRPGATSLNRKTRLQGLTLNSRYRFENFVIGASNQFAHAAARAVADAPATSYNPLFIYGSSGLGKTHLLQAIGHQLLERGGLSTICYTTSEEFTNQFINSIRFDRGEAFRDRYRSVDVLIIDDIQFISGKTGTQEAFFHTFNTLFEQQKQIVLSSDSGPNHIPKLESRLKSRFQWGLSSDIQPPPLETRIAILRKKAEAAGTRLPDDVLLYIANKITSNVRELEGALIKVIASGSLGRRKITLDLAEQCLQGMLYSEDSRLSCEKIQAFIAKHYNLTPKDLCSKTHSKRVARPRQIAMYLTRRLTGMSLPEIGSAFGDKHHSTVLYSVKKIDQWIHADPEAQRLLTVFEKSLR